MFLNYWIWTQQSHLSGEWEDMDHGLGLAQECESGEGARKVFVAEK